LRPPVDVRAALHGELQTALELLARPRLDDESIHRVRQALKRVRAALRLLHEAVSEAAYARENASLRDAARPLAAARDAHVMLGVLDELIAGKQCRPYRPMLVRFRLQLRKVHARRLAGASTGRALSKMRALLERSLERTARWRMPRDPRAVYNAGIRRIYRQGRDALENARAKGSPEALHEWRKQVKYLAAAMALLGPEKSRTTKPRKVAEEAARRLGDDHDLAVLAAALLRRAADRRLIAKLEQRRHKLQKRAFKLGRRLYKHPPARFAARLENI
jgi:hypothetical protein